MHTDFESISVTKNPDITKPLTKDIAKDMAKAKEYNSQGTKELGESGKQADKLLQELENLEETKTLQEMASDMFDFEKTEYGMNTEGLFAELGDNPQGKMDSESRYVFEGNGKRLNIDTFPGNIKITLINDQSGEIYSVRFEVNEKADLSFSRRESFDFEKTFKNGTISSLEGFSHKDSLSVENLDLKAVSHKIEGPNFDNIAMISTNSKGDIVDRIYWSDSDWENDDFGERIIYFDTNQDGIINKKDKINIETSEGFIEDVSWKKAKKLGYDYIKEEAQARLENLFKN